MGQRFKTIGWCLFLGSFFVNLFQSFNEKDYSEAVAWACCIFYALLIWTANTKKE